MKEAEFYKKLKSNLVQCQLCPKKCTIAPNNFGNCRARKNIKGKLYSVVYGKLAATHVDPIEKKPLYHFLPGTKSLSISTTGCNLHCRWCQNWEISQTEPDISLKTTEPKEIVELAKKYKCPSISYTYVEPFIFFEFMRDTAKLAKRAGIKNVAVTNGFVNPKPLKEMCKYLDTANVDIKSASSETYKKYCDVWLEPILESIKIMLKNKVWVELTNLIVTSVNDKEKQIKEVINLVKKEFGTEVPLHFSAYYPAYKFHEPATRPEIVKHARELALKAGLKYVYTGNIQDGVGNTTFCPKCRKPVIERSWFSSLNNLLKAGKCPFCKNKIYGVW